MSDVSAALMDDERRDREWLRRVAARDRSALEQLYRAYQARLLQFLSRLSSQRASLEEAVNDTFWVVWNKAGDFRGDSRVSTWIMGIGWRCALKALRRNADPVTEVLALQPANEDANASGLIQEERLEWLRRGLSLLPIEQRATVQLAYFAGYSCAEIADIMECPVNTVKARMFQARIKLRNLLPRLGGLAADAAGGSTL